MLTLEQKEQFSQILEELGNALDITEEQHTSAVRSYEFVGSHLAAENSPLAKYNPEILPQGSFLLGTMIKPIHEEDELDIDLVCRLEGKNPGWTQYDLKQIIGNRLKDHGTLNRLLKTPDGRRCWTLEYSDARRFHLDILPSIVSSGYRYILEKAFAAKEHQDMECWQYALLIKSWVTTGPVRDQKNGINAIHLVMVCGSLSRPEYSPIKQCY